ncbi:hypothetical protein ACFTTN_31800 [Streptomyces niveus]|uniref:hypothetical protein n=1 Tax=Streptomyces niveus TaxID=193462 RepID=UPI00363A6456
MTPIPSTIIDDLLAHAAVPTSDPRTFDVPRALRRLAADAARMTPPPEIQRATLAGQMLSVVSRWVLNKPDAAMHMEQIAVDETGALMTEDQMDVDGAVVFACLLNLTGHPESAQFWWEFAAGAGSGAAVYCLHLHHRRLGESKEAAHWYDQLAIRVEDGSTAPTATFIEGLEAVARYVCRNPSTANQPTGGLEGEVNRLASRNAKSHVIVPWPDRRLADQLRRFTSRR